MSKICNVVPIGTRHRAISCSKKMHQRSREVVARTGGSVRGCFPSFKMNRLIDWESQLERRACYRFEFSSGVVAYQEQPASVRFRLHDKLVKYTPDFELTLSSGEVWFVEIKPAEKLQKSEISERLSLAASHYKKEGYQFIVITDEELIHLPLERNLVFLRNYLSHEISLSTEQLVRRWIATNDEPTVGKLIAHFPDKTTAYALLSQQIIASNFFEPITLDSTLYLPKEDCHAALLFSYRTASDF